MEDIKDHPIIKAYIANNHFGAELNMSVALEDGVIMNRMPIEQKHLATPIAAHGGAVCSLMDATMGICALAQVIRDDFVVSTIEMKISFVSPAMKGQELIGVANVVKAGKRIIFVEGKIHNDAGELVAQASGTFNAYPVTKAGFIKT